VTGVKAVRLFLLSLMVIYAGGVIFSHLEYSADDRAACHRAGGLVGRIWCPDSVDTEGFSVHFVKALGWPAAVIQATNKPARNTNNAFAASKRGNAAEPASERNATSLASISEAQTLLKKLGYQVGDIDGVTGARTREAISKFQRRDGMQLSGEVSDELIIRLRNSVRASQNEAVGAQ
jgi:hypothetical protein